MSSMPVPLACLTNYLSDRKPNRHKHLRIKGR